MSSLEAKDVNVSISGDVLTITGEKKTEEKEKDEHYHCAERYSGSFQRVFQLPSGVKADPIETTFDKGVLKVILPKVEEAEKKEIEIKSIINITPYGILHGSKSFRYEIPECGATMTRE